MKIIYSDVCKDNIVRDTLKQWFPTITGDYGYFKIDIDGEIVDADVDRHETHAGNQYINFGEYRVRYKLAFNKEFDIEKLKAKVYKLAENQRQRKKDIETTQNYRGRLYREFDKLNKAKRYTMNFAYSEGKYNIEVSGTKHKYQSFGFSAGSVESEYKEVVKYFKEYEKEQTEIKAILEKLQAIK
jgi:hypothetical protein